MDDSTLKKLIFIYNADSDLGSMLLDGVHKILSPSTYECSLCSLTFGAFTEKSEWKNYREESAVEMEFLHKDEFMNQYASKFGHKFTYPIVLVKNQNGLEVILNTEKLNQLADVKSLIEILREIV